MTSDRQSSKDVIIGAVLQLFANSDDDINHVKQEPRLEEKT